MLENLENLQTIVSELLVNIGDNSAASIWSFLTYFFILLIFILAINKGVDRSDLSKRNNYFGFINSHIFFSFIVALAIITLRLPQLSKSECNPDESQWIAGALTLLQDPRYWLSVDGTTSGPLISFSLILIKVFGGTINYGTVKLFGILIWIFSILFVYYSFRKFLQETIARLIILPLTICISSLSFCDYLAYNSEHIPILQISASTYLFALIHSKREKSKIIHIIFLGFILGTIPYSKLQAVPIALIIALYTSIFLRGKNLLSFIGAGIFPTLLVLLYLLGAGAFNDFWTSYIINNFIYAKKGLGNQNLTFFQKAERFPDFLFSVTDTTHYFKIQIVLILLLLSVLLIKFRKQITKEEYKFAVLAFLIFVTSIYSVIQPGNLFTHYLLLLIVPFSFLSGSLFGILYNKFTVLSDYIFYKFLLIVSGTVIFFSSIIYLTAKNPTVFVEAPFQFNNANTRSVMARKILQYKQPGDRMAIWGWENKYYVETQLAQGSRDPHTYYQIINNPAQEYYVNRYASDLKNNKPTFFLDAVSPNQFYFMDSTTQSHEKFPLIKKVVDSLYKFVEEYEGIKLYVLKIKDLKNNIKSLKKAEKLPEENQNISYNVEQIKIDTNGIDISGWAFINGRSTRGSKVKLILKSDNETYIVEPLLYMRPDVTYHFNNDLNLTRSGFYSFIPKAQLPPANLKLGIYIEDGQESWFTFTDKSISF